MPLVPVACPELLAAPLARGTLGVRRDRARGCVRADAQGGVNARRRHARGRQLGDVSIGREHDRQRRVLAQRKRTPRRRFGQRPAQRRGDDRANLSPDAGILAHPA